MTTFSRNFIEIKKKFQDWNLLVKPNEFEEYLKRMERWVAEDTVSRTGQFTYNELLQLTSSMPSESSTSSFIQVLKSHDFLP